jgi:hypothetical protein
LIKKKRRGIKSKFLFGVFQAPYKLQGDFTFMKIKVSTKISIGITCAIVGLFIMEIVSSFPAHGQTRKLSEDEMGAIIWGKGKEIKGEIHIGQPTAHQSELWVVTTLMPTVKEHLMVYPPNHLGHYLNVETEIKISILGKSRSAEKLNQTADFLLEPCIPIIIPLSSKELFKQPFLIIYGKKEVKLSEEEIENLREYLVNKGGFLFADEADGIMEGGEFLSSIKEILKQAMPEYPIKKIPKDYEIYRNFYELTGTPRGHAKTSSDLEGIFIDGRLAVIFSDRSYSTLWATTGSPELGYIPETFQFGVNVIVYAVTHGKIADYSGYTK